VVDAISEPPIVEKEITVNRPAVEVFRRFTQDMHLWWPLASHSIFGADAVWCGMEPRVGGRVYERARDGRESQWGEIIVWEPGRRLAYTWHVGREARFSSEVELHFDAVSASVTRVRLTHGKFARMAGADAGKLRENYNNGWDLVLGTLFLAHANAV